MIFNNMNVKEIISSGLKKFLSDWKNILLCILVIAIAVLGIINNSSQRKIEKLIAEKIELADSLFEYKNKTGELYQAKETYITTISDLKKLNDDLAKEVKNLKDNPIVVTKIEYETQIKEVHIIDSLEVLPDSTYKSSFAYKNDWANIEGFTMFDFKNSNSYTNIDLIGLKGNFYFDIIEKDKHLYSIARTDNPYIQINNIENAIISPEKSKVLKNHFRRPWGIMAGIGPSVVLVGNTVKIYPAVQVTIGYKFIDF